MTHRLQILATLLGSICWLGSCQQVPQLTVSTVSLSTSTPPTVVSMVGTATSIYTPMLAVTPSTPTLPATLDSYPLSITAMQASAYPGSDIVIERTLSPGLDYNRYIVSYQSDGLILFGLLTVPIGAKPAGGWPVILLNHGYIPPTEYSTG